MAGVIISSYSSAVMVATTRDHDLLLMMRLADEYTGIRSYKLQDLENRHPGV